ncbi:histidine--tRNA ligase [candidate division CSSED10-310 bacterium]|uniref:Histidine--tRNA ligase n=1 Tax=candidate division CSSED10-310 bacterium TaxID=2855610 RepID=A0ABV6YUB1_UNCC1
MKKIEPKLPKGMRDLEPGDMIIRNRVLTLIKATFEKYGYEPLETPALEYWEILTGKYGQEAERLVYHLTDHGGRHLGLRYDLTVPLARYIASHQHLLKPFKRYQIQPVWRAEKPQKGRYREFYQCDVDAVGSASMIVDAELIALTVEIFDAIGFKNFETRVNNRKILQAMVQAAGIESGRSADVCQSLDKFEKIGWDQVESELLQKGYTRPQISVLGELRLFSGDNFTILSDVEKILGGIPVGDEGIQELREILECLAAMDVEQKHIKLRPTMTRGLDYYTGPIFETFLTDRTFSSLGGGGRYDGLVGIFSRETIPASGTSFGLDRIVAALHEIGQEQTGSTTTEILVVLFSTELKSEAISLVSRCRKAGFRSELYYEPVKLRKQFSYANQKGIPLVLLIGDVEAEEQAVQLKDMKNGVQETVPLQNLEERLSEKLKRGKERS